jgi:hypothetical protein
MIVRRRFLKEDLEAIINNRMALGTLAWEVSVALVSLRLKVQHTKFPLGLNK